MKLRIHTSASYSSLYAKFSQKIHPHHRFLYSSRLLLFFITVNLLFETMIMADDRLVMVGRWLDNRWLRGQRSKSFRDD
ncbi:hypothetical protein LINPERHAP1_LOCUS7611 [Linum perenne]